MARFALNPDYRDFLSACNAQNVEYLVIEGQAVIFYGSVRNTKDLDIWINPTPERYWDQTASTRLVRGLFSGRMVPMTAEGIARGVKDLR